MLTCQVTQLAGGWAGIWVWEVSPLSPWEKWAFRSEQITFQSRELCPECHRSLPSAVYHAIYLEELTAVELTEKIAQLFSISPCQISQIYKQGPTGIHVLISDEVGFQHSSITRWQWFVWADDRSKDCSVGQSGRFSKTRGLQTLLLTYLLKKFLKVVFLHIFRMT